MGVASESGAGARLRLSSSSIKQKIHFQVVYKCHPIRRENSSGSFIKNENIIIIMMMIIINGKWFNYIL